MAFVKISNKRITLINRDAQVSMGVYSANGKDVKTRSIAFRFTTPLIQQLGWDIEEDFRVAVFEGVRDDAGTLQLAPDPAGYKVQDKAKHGRAPSYSVVVGVKRLQHYILNDTLVDMSPVVYLVDGNSLIIECPDWLVYNQLTAPPELPKIETPPAPEPEPVKLPPFPIQNSKANAQAVSKHKHKPSKSRGYNA